MVITGFDVHQKRMPLAESSPSDVLATQPDRRSLVKKRGKGQRLGIGPVNSLPGFNSLQALFQKRRNLRMGAESLRYCRQ